MKVSEEYREANGLTPEKIADTLMAWYRRIDEISDALIQKLKSNGIHLNCHAGCCGCCRDELTMTQSEAAVIRRLFPDIGKEAPHAAGACPFLDERGLCRIYAARPYICRTHGLPMQMLISLEEAQAMGLDVDASDGDESASLEIRDICEENADVVDVMELSDEMCWNGEVAETQLATMDVCAFGNTERVSMRSFFEN